MVVTVHRYPIDARRSRKGPRSLSAVAPLGIDARLVRARGLCDGMRDASRPVGRFTRTGGQSKKTTSAGRPVSEGPKL